MKGIMIILGHTNDNQGRLSSISKERLDLGFKSLEKGYKIIATGAFGGHFNTTKKMHASYSKEYLLKKGISKSLFLKIAKSSHTVEDALFSHVIIGGYKVKDIVVVTSDFHMARVKFIFGRIFKNYNLKFLSSKTEISEEKMKKLKSHEQKTLRKLKREGIYY
ncbi:YdcF family protein [Candidatus Woesearchaeota archaeon]|nr:YdcF family protein [Candidatus Woesearchaeota archaeon]